MIDALFRLDGAQRDHPQVRQWFATQPAGLSDMAERWFGTIRRCGSDVLEVMHDGQATACVEDAAFACAGIYSAHVNLGFFHGADLPDPARLLQGSGKRMRHVKLFVEKPVDEAALHALIAAAYRDITERLAAISQA